MRISDWSSDVLFRSRDHDGALRVFHNVCSHRGLRLVTEPCRARGLIRCPYHSWSYALDGSLKATPFIGGPGTSTCEGFDKAGHGLKPVRSAVWADAVFVDLSGQAPAFAEIGRASVRERVGRDGENSGVAV